MIGSFANNASFAKTKIAVAGNLSISATGSMSATAGSDLSLTPSGNLNLNPTGNLSANPGASFNVIAAGGNVFIQSTNGVLNLVSKNDMTLEPTVGNLNLAPDAGEIISTGSDFSIGNAAILLKFQIGNVASSGPIGTAANTVDKSSFIAISQTTPGAILTLPNPTNGAAGRIAIIINIGSTSFTMYGKTIAPGSMSIFVYIAGWNALA